MRAIGCLGALRGLCVSCRGIGSAGFGVDVTVPAAVAALDSTRGCGGASTLGCEKLARDCGCVSAYIRAQMAWLWLDGRRLRRGCDLGGAETCSGF